MSWDLDSLVAIDTHVHVEQDSHGCCSIDQELMDASAAYFKGNDNRTPTVGDLATYYRERRIGAVVFTVDSTTATGHPALSSEEIIDLVAEHDDILIPFASVDPLADDAAGPRAIARGARREGLQVPSEPAAVRAERRAVLPDLRGHRRGRSADACSTPDRPASAPGCPAVAASSCATAIRCCSTTSPPTSRR